MYVYCIMYTHVYIAIQPAIYKKSSIFEEYISPVLCTKTICFQIRKKTLIICLSKFMGLDYILISKSIKKFWSQNLDEPMGSNASISNINLSFVIHYIIPLYHTAIFQCNHIEMPADISFQL